MPHQRERKRSSSLFPIESLIGGIHSVLPFQEHRIPAQACTGQADTRHIPDVRSEWCNNTRALPY